MSPPLDALLEGFAEELHPRGWHGRFRKGDKVRVELKGGRSIVARVVRPADTKEDSHVIVQPENGGPHVEAPVDDVKLDSPARSDREHQAKVARDFADSLARGDRGAPPPAGKGPGRPRRGAHPRPMGRAFHPTLGTRVKEAAVDGPGVLGALLEGAGDRMEESIGPIEKGAFHRWLGKPESEPITDADIARGLAAGGHPAKMAQFAKASRGFAHGGKK